MENKKEYESPKIIHEEELKVTAGTCNQTDSSTCSSVSGS